jgi:hypothetical protein
MKSIFALCLLAFAVVAQAADPVFSGPQPGEKATPFKVLELTGEGAGKEREINADVATAVVFLHGVERSLVPLLRTVDQYGAQRKERIKTEIVFLSGDRLEGEQRGKAVSGSLKLQGRVGLSVDGAEGPGNYGLNKECLMTILAVKDGKVAANFALVQPGIADAPKVIAALAKACGDEAPPTIEQLAGRPADGRAMQEGSPREMRPKAAAAADLAKFDLNTEAGLRDAVRALIGEVQSLRAELAARDPRRVPARPEAAASREPFPGAVPTDDTLNGLLRRFIRPTNDDATVDKVLGEVRAHIKDNADLRKQAKDGWIRVLHFGDQYGTEYSRKVGRAFLEELQKEAR